MLSCFWHLPVATALLDVVCCSDCCTLTSIRHSGRFIRKHVSFLNICCIPLTCGLIHYICPWPHQLNGTAPVLLGSYWLEMLGRALPVSVICRPSNCGSQGALMRIGILIGGWVKVLAFSMPVSAWHACSEKMVGTSLQYYSRATHADTNRNQATSGRPHAKVLTGNCCGLCCS